MPRSLDEPIPEDEMLLRRVEPTYVDGDRVLPGGMSLHLGCSLLRRKYLTEPPFDCLFPRQDPTRCCVVHARCGDVPMGAHTDLVGGKHPQEVGYFVFVADDPRDAEGDFPPLPAHAEIRVQREGEDYVAAIRLRPKFRKRLEVDISRRFRVCYRPSTSTAGACPEASSPEWRQVCEGGFLASDIA